MDSKTNRAAGGLERTPCYSNTFLSRGNYRYYFTSIAVFRRIGCTLAHKPRNSDFFKMFFCTVVFGPNQHRSNLYFVRFFKPEKIKCFGTPPILIQLHPFKHRCHYKILVSKIKYFLLFFSCWFFKRHPAPKSSSVFCPSLGYCRRRVLCIQSSRLQLRLLTIGLTTSAVDRHNIC